MTNLQQITLETLHLSFGVDITPAYGLQGHELDLWIERVEDEVFEREHAELRAQRQKMTSEEPKIAWQELAGTWTTMASRKQSHASSSSMEFSMRRYA